jgi:peptidoglycan/LPS O-acetylase OafA/YrhL
MYFCWVLLLLHGGPGWIQRLLSAPVFRRIATLGYGVYLLHIPVFEWFVARGAASLALEHHWSGPVVWTLSLFAVLAGALVVAYALHVAIEKPALRLRDRFAR